MMKRTIVAARSVALSVVILVLTTGWGSVGHRIINGSVVGYLPSEMIDFVHQAQFLAGHASDADNRKSADGQKPYLLKESPRHFIDIDAYPEFSTKTVPKDFDTLIGRYDSATVFSRGTVPWAILWTFDSLTMQLGRGDWLSAWQSAADLGHYVGDTFQPLHNTKDYDGRSSIPGSKGIHSRYESDMVSSYQSLLSIQPGSVSFVTNPIDVIFESVYQTNVYVDSIYDADIYARQQSGWNGSGNAPQSYYTKLWEKTGTFTQLQFQRAAQNYANLLFTAWTNAGSPHITAVHELSAFNQLPNAAWLGQNYPNPFNPSTTIAFRVPVKAHVSLTLYSITGNEICELVNEVVSAGAHESRLDAGALSLSSGIYFYRLSMRSTEDTRTMTKKLIYIK